MKRLIKSLSKSKYDPVAYWNARKNPNSDSGLESARVRFDTEYIAAAVGGASSVFELGPGVGRTFDAYSSGQKITTLDLSKSYTDQLRRRAEASSIDLTMHFLDSALAEFPFCDGAFPIGVTSQVLLHVPPDNIEHTISELCRTCGKIVVISLFIHGKPVSGPWGRHVFNHDYPMLFSERGWALSDVVFHEERLLFVASPRD